MKTTNKVSRRSFLATTTAGAAAVAVAPSMAFAARREPLRFAQIGCGGKGESDHNEMLGAGAKVIAHCDVDSVNAKKVFEKHPDVPKFKDFRQMLDKHEKDIDAVVVSTPDHMHGAAALDAMRRGKHVYVQKPLARTFQECQAMLDLSRKNKLVTQMGNQGHAGSGLKLWEEMAKAQAFGDILKIETWSDRPIWGQGMTEAPKEQPVPATLDWDLWLGPAAKRPFGGKTYVPFSWRGWWDFGCGAMGDMACHNMDPAFWIFKLGLPLSIKAQASAPAGIAYPEWSIIEYKFGPTPSLPKGVALTWYDGKKLPAPAAGMNPAPLKPGSNGCLVIGSKMTALGGSHAGTPHVVAVDGKGDEGAIKDADKHWQDVHKGLKGTNHYGQWVHAAEAKDAATPGSNFEYAVPFTQGILLGCIALRFPGQELLWDNEKKQFSNFKEANEWLSFKPREGYNLNA